MISQLNLKEQHLQLLTASPFIFLFLLLFLITSLLCFITFPAKQIINTLKSNFRYFLTIFSPPVPILLLISSLTKSKTQRREIFFAVVTKEYFFRKPFRGKSKCSSPSKPSGVELPSHTRGSSLRRAPKQSSSVASKD